MADTDVGWSEAPSRQNAHANIQAAQGVTPQAGVTAITKGGPLGIPPSVGMTQPQYVNRVADQTGWSEAVNNHPPVANFAATSPAHAAAASGSTEQLAGVSDRVQHSYFSDVADRWAQGQKEQNAAWSEIGHASFNPNDSFLNIGGLVKVPLNTVPNGMGPAIGGALGAWHLVGGAWNSLVSPGAGALDTLQRNMGLSNQEWARFNVPGTDKYVAFGLRPTSFGDIGQNIAGLFVGARGGKARLKPGEMPPPGETPRSGGPGPTSPDAMGRQPFHNGTGWNTNEEGFLADEQGSPVGFNSPREAASWRMKHGGDQVFEPDLHSEGVGLRDVEARPGDPYWEARRSREPAPGMDEQVDEARASRADHDAETSANIEKSVSETPLHSQSPELMEQFLEHDPALAGRNVQVDPNVLRELYTQGHTPFRGMMDDIEEAMFRGTTLSVPYTKYLAEVSGKPWAEQVRAGTAFTEGGVSQNEAGEVKDMHASQGDTSASLTPGAGFSIKDLPVYSVDQNKIVDRILAEAKGIKAEDMTDVKENPIPRGEIPHEVQYGKNQRTNAELREKINEAHANATVQTVPLSQIRSPQRSITGSHAEKAEPKPPESDIRGELPKGAEDVPVHGTLEKYRGEYYVRDGNHRIVKLLAEGKEEGQFSVIDLDKHLETGWRPAPERPAYEAPKDIPKEFHEPLRSIAAAVESHIDEIFQEQALGKVFESPKAAGMTKAQFDRYNNALENAKFDLRERVMNKLYNQIKKERTPDWKAAVELAKEEATKSLNEHPNIVAYKNLKDPMFKLNSQTVKELAPDIAEEFPKNLQKQGGTDPDDMAEILGYSSGKEMIKEMVLLQRAMDAVGAKSIDSFVKSSANIMAQLRARELAGFDGSPEGIEREVRETATGPAMEDFLIAELKAIKDLAPDQPMDLNQIKEKAQDIFGKMTVKEASSIKLAERAVWKTGNATQYALEKGNWVAAFKAKQQQLLNHYILEQTHGFVKERKAFEREAGRLARSKSRPNILQEDLNRIHGFLQDYGYNVPQTQLKFDYDQWQEEQRALGVPVQPYARPAPQDISKLSVIDFRDVADRLDNMVHLAKDAKTIEVAGERLSMQKLIEEALQAAEQVKKKPILPDATITKGRLTPGQVDAWMFNPHVMVAILDNRNPNGVFNRLLIQGARKAAVTEHDIIGPEDQAIADILKDLGLKKWTRLQRYVPKGHGLMRPDRPGLEANLTYNDLIGIMLHMGHKEGRWHLEEGGWGWERAKYEDLVLREATKGDWELADRVVKVLDSMWPKIAENEKNMGGLVPERVKARPIILERDLGLNANGQQQRRVEIHDGGYFPLRRDDRISSALKGKAKADTETLFAHFLQEGATPKGHTVRRVAASYVPSLDWMDTLQTHVPNVAKRIAYGKWALDTLKFISQPEIVKLIEDVHGPYAWNEMRGWLQRQLGYRSIDPRAPAEIDGVFREFRTRTYSTVAAWKITIMLEHATSIFQTMSQAGLGTTMRGLVEFAKNPVQAEQLAVTKSDYMRIRSAAVTRELRDIIDDIKNNRSTIIPVIPFIGRVHLPVADPAMMKVREFSAKFFAAYNHWLAATPAWIGAYKDALEGKAVPSGRLKPVSAMSDEEAVAFADSVVAKSHGSGFEMDMGTFQSGGGSEFLKTLNMWNIFRGTFGSLLREGAYHAFQGTTTEEKIAGWKQYLIAAVAVVSVAKAVTDHLPKNAKEFVWWQFHNMLEAMTHTVPFGPNVFQFLEDIKDGKKPDFQVSPVEGVMTSAGQGAGDIVKASQGKKVTDKKAVENAGILAGMLFNLPGAGQAGETLQSIYDMAHPGKAGRVTRPVPALIYGPTHERDRKEK